MKGRFKSRAPSFVRHDRKEDQLVEQACDLLRRICDDFSPDHFTRAELVEELTARSIGHTSVGYTEAQLEAELATLVQQELVEKVEDADPHYRVTDKGIRVAEET